MSQAQQSSLEVTTLAKWMLHHHDNINEVVAALCQIFDLPKPKLAKEHLEEEIETQARLLLIVDEGMVVALAGWNWAHLGRRQVELPVYLGIRHNVEIDGLRMLLLDSVIKLLKEDRIRTDNKQIVTALLQYHPRDYELRDLGLDLGFTRSTRYVDRFRDSLDAAGCLYTMTAPIDS